VTYSYSLILLMEMYSGEVKFTMNVISLGLKSVKFHVKFIKCSLVLRPGSIPTSRAGLKIPSTNTVSF